MRRKLIAQFMIKELINESKLVLIYKYMTVSSFDIVA